MIPSRSLLPHSVAAGGLLLALGGAVAAGGCSDDARPAASGGRGDVSVPSACVDEDHDGFGKGCAKGPDCNDQDPDVSTGCLDCSAAGTQGCACAAGSTLSCGKVEETLAGGVRVCGQGTVHCEAGLWGTCQVDPGLPKVVTVAPDVTSSSPGQHVQTLGTASTCSTNPCDPYCVTFPDTPTGLGNPDAGIVETDAGISLPKGDPPIPASGCTGGAYRGCTHHLCQTGTALTAGCDTAALPCTVQVSNGRTYLFCNQSLSWTAARDYCQAQGFNLATINSAAENAFVASSANAVAASTSWWIGYNDSKTEGQYIWQDGASATYLAWAAGKPTGAANNDCVQIASNGATWSDTTCATTQRFVCEGIPLSGSSCVTQVCAAQPSCCSSSWDASCLALMKTTCSVDCAANDVGSCLFCYKDAVDHDGDGYSNTQGDCRDCDPGVNPGAYDFPANGQDEDCSGTVDDQVTTCDTPLAYDSSNADDHARAIELCQFTDAAATGANKKWGVINGSAKLVRADGTTATGKPLQYGILPNWGTTVAVDPVFNKPINAPRAGAKMAVYSSGTARDAFDTGWINPNGQSGSYNSNTFATPPTGFPKNAAGCPNGTAAYDSSGLVMQIRVPTNAQSFQYNFSFLSTEYPEWVCTSYNDSFIAVLDSNHPLNLANAGAPNYRNISFDAANNPISVNVGFFSIPGGPYATSNKLTGTGFDGTCNNYGNFGLGNGICGGGTDWLQTTAPVLGGETIKVLFNIWDTGDHVWDSTVLIDNWRWSTNPSGISTLPNPPQPPQQYNEGSFIRDYDMSNVCPVGTSIVYGLWSWGATTPGDSKIEFYVAASATAAGLPMAAETALKLSNPPGPAPLAGTPASANTAQGTTTGAASVHATLVSAGLNTKTPYLRVRSRLMPTTDKLSAPTLSSWNLAVSCPPSE